MGAEGLCWSWGWGEGEGEGGDGAGVVAAAGREFVAACKIPPFFSFFITPGTQLIL